MSRNLSGRVSLLIRASFAAAMVAGLGSALSVAADNDLMAVWRDVFTRPAATPVTPEERLRGQLGRDLLRDARLSADGRMSCISCHMPARAFADGRRTARGRNGQPLQRNTPTLYGIAAASEFNWDGSAPSLTAQFERPITSTDEMAGEWPVILRRLNADGGLVRRFRSAFPEQDVITRSQIKHALASGIRTLRPPETRFDRWLLGERAALSELEVAGFQLFVGRGQCATCHSGWRFTDDAFYDIGLAGADPGRGAVVRDAPSVPAFKTPTLRVVAQTAPYFHDGSAATLADAVGHYAGGLIHRPSVSSKINRNLDLTNAERAALIAFLRTL